MTPAEFAARAVGIPWRRWAASWEAADCFGLVVLFHREVLGLDVGPVPQTDIAAGFAAAQGWLQCDPMPGATGFMTWRDGAPTHCGVLALPGMLLHAEEGHPVAERGAVRLTRMAVMQRACPDRRCDRHESMKAC